MNLNTVIFDMDGLLIDSEPLWQEAANDIFGMNGIHISKEEQKKRFDERLTNPLKKYKIGKEDFRNRDKWDDYLKAYEEMFERTDTAYAPWNIIPGNDKDYARIKIMKTIVKRLKEDLV